VPASSSHEWAEQLPVQIAAEIAVEPSEVPERSRPDV
jgi:hypothetical protein